MRTQREKGPEPETRMPRRQPTLRAGTSKRTCHYAIPEAQLMMSEREMEKQVKTKSNKDGFSDQHRVLVANIEIIRLSHSQSPHKEQQHRKRGFSLHPTFHLLGFVICSNPGLDTAQNRERHWGKVGNKAMHPYFLKTIFLPSTFPGVLKLKVSFPFPITNAHQYTNVLVVTSREQSGSGHVTFLVCLVLEAP